MTSILIVTTNTEKINNEIKTGVYFEEFAVPYLVFEATGYKITVASPKGGISPIDENSLSCSSPNEWDTTAKFLKETIPLNQINPDDFDAIFFPGGHGPMFDLYEDNEVKKIVEDFYQKNKVISAVCHGVAALLSARKEKGKSILFGKNVTGFTNKEEEISKMAEFMPFYLQNRIEDMGGNFIEKEPFTEHVEVDNNIITGQNQHSALKVAEEIVKKL